MPARKPSEIHTLFLDAFNRGDIEALVALYEPNAALVTKDRTVIGHDAIRKAYQQLVARGGHMELETRVVIAGDDGLAILHAGWTYYRGGTAIRGLSTEVVRRQSDGMWLYIIDEPRTPTSP